MDIRPLTAADRESAAALWEQTGFTRPWNDPGSDFDRAVAGPTSAVLGAVRDTGMVATVMVGHDGHRGWVYYLAVEPSQQRRRLGARMMRDAEDWLRLRGVVKLNLMVRHGNADAMSFYRRLGYEDAEVSVLARWLR